MSIQFSENNTNNTQIDYSQKHDTYSNYLKIKIHSKEFKFDYEDFDKICGCNDSTFIYRWKLTETDQPYILDKNNNYIYLINKIFGEKIENRILFKNDDIYDYRKKNIIKKNFYDKIKFNIDNTEIEFPVLQVIDGHLSNLGKSAGKIKNNIYKINHNNNDIYLIDCSIDNKNIFTQISSQSIDKIKKFNDQILTWYKLTNGYIGSHVKINKIDDQGNEMLSDTIIYLHQHLMDFYNKTSNLFNKKLSVDHINRDKLDNRLENLRIVNQSKQNSNTDKRKRKNNAKTLPDGLTQDMIPKYVVYYQEFYDKDKTKSREYFKIEKHPELDKPIIGSKSNKLSIKKKLTEIKNKLNSISNSSSNNSISNTISTNNDLKYPKGVYLSLDRFILDLKLATSEETKRLNMKMKLDKNKNEKENYGDFVKKIYDKYQYKL